MTLALASSVLLLGGCFSYVETSPDAVPPGEDVRVRVSRAALAELPEEVAARGPIFSGTLLSGDGAVTVQVPLTRAGSAFAGPPVTHDIRLDASDVVQFERKELDKQSTALLVGGAVGVTALALRAFVFGGSGDGGREEPDPELIRIPLFSIVP